MKKNKLTLEKFQIVKLTDSSRIFGGTGESTVCDTDTNPITTTTGGDPTDSDPTSDDTTNGTSTATQGTRNTENKTTTDGISTVPTCPS